MSSPQQPWSPGQAGQPGPAGQQPYPGQPYPPQPYPPQPYAPQPYQAQPYAPQPPAGPTGELVLNLRKPFGAMGMISPVVRIDGYPASASWGRNSFVVPAGVRQVEVAQTYLWTYGRATQPVSVEPGRTSEIFYAGPMATFGMGGAMGTEPQKRPGTALFVGVMVLVLVVLLIAVLAAALGSS